MKLTAENVEIVLKDSLFRPEEIVNGESPVDAIRAQGIMLNFGFHPQRLLSHLDDVSSMLDDLDDNFKEEKGGGWSFLNACMTKDGTQWGEHRNIDELLCLGIGLDLVRFQFPREMWRIFPGGVPYFTIKSPHPRPEIR